MPSSTPLQLRLPSSPFTRTLNSLSEAVHRALQLRSQLAIGGHELEAAVDARHRAHGDEPIAGAARQALEQRRVFGRLLGSAQVFTRRAMAQIHLSRRDFVAMDEPAVEPQMVRAPDARAEHCDLAVHGEAPGADPLLRLAAGSHAQPRQHLLQPLAVRDAAPPSSRGAWALAASAGRAAPCDSAARTIAVIAEAERGRAARCCHAALIAVRRDRP